MEAYEEQKMIDRILTTYNNSFYPIFFFFSIFEGIKYTTFMILPSVILWKHFESSNIEKLLKLQSAYFHVKAP